MIRDNHDLSQKALAITAGMDQSYLAGLESGRRPPPRDKQLLRLTQALQATDQEKRALLTARTMSRLSNVLEEFGEERAKSLTAIVEAVNKLPGSESQILKTVAKLLENLTTGGSQYG